MEKSKIAVILTLRQIIEVDGTDSEQAKKDVERKLMYEGVEGLLPKPLSEIMWDSIQIEPYGSN